MIGRSRRVLSALLGVAIAAPGARAAEGKTHVHDIHATILHLLGFNHKKLTFRHNGRSDRLTDNAGEVIENALA